MHIIIAVKKLGLLNNSMDAFSILEKEEILPPMIFLKMKSTFSYLQRFKITQFSRILRKRKVTQSEIEEKLKIWEKKMNKD